MGITLNRRSGVTVILLFWCCIDAAGRRLEKKTHHLTVCANSKQGVTLTSSYPRGSYRWSTGETSLSIIISKAGIYRCTARYRQQQLEEVFEIDEKRVPPPDIPANDVICKVEEVKMRSRPGLLWYRYGDDDIASGTPSPPDISRNTSDFSLYVAQQEGGCTSEKKEIRFEFLFYMLCPDFINRKRSRQ